VFLKDEHYSLGSLLVFLRKLLRKLYSPNSNADNNNLDGCAYINIRPQFGYSNVKVKFGDSLSYKKAFMNAKKNKTRGELTDK